MSHRSVHSRSNSHVQVPIDLLIVQEDAKDVSGQPNIARGLSIKLVPPEDEESDENLPNETPTFYHSTSQLSATSFDSVGGGSLSALDIDIPIPAQADRLSDLDASRRLVGAPPPLHRTESRLPSLENMLRDEKLSHALYEGAKSPILDALTHALLEKDVHDRFRALQAMIRRQTTTTSLDMNQATPKQRSLIIDTAVLFVKQQLARAVDFWRTMMDSRELGQITPEEFDLRILNPPSDFGVRPWAFISLGLKLLRNYCTNKDVQNLIYQHDIADLIIQRRRLLMSAFAQALNLQRKDPEIGKRPDKHFIEEVATALPRSVLTFISNLVTNNDRLRAHLWPRMWPDCYWAFLLLAGNQFFDHYCLLLHNHMTPLLSHESSMPEADEEAELMMRSYSGEVRALERDLVLLSCTEEEVALKKANMSPEDAATMESLTSDFANTMTAILMVIWRKHQTRSEGHRKARLASVQGRAYQEEAVSEDWFALFLLRLLSLGQGHSLRLLLTMLLKRSDPPDHFKDMDEALSYLGCPRMVRSYAKHMPQVYKPDNSDELPMAKSSELAAIILYAVAEYASVPQDEAAIIQKHVECPDSDTEETSSATKKKASTGVREKAEQKLGRRWNLVRRSFLTPATVTLIIALTKEAVASLVTAGITEHAEAVQKTKSWLNDHPMQGSGIGHGNLAHLMRPLCKCLISLLTAPELIGRWTDDNVQTCWTLAVALLTDFAPFLQASLAVPGSPEAQTYEEVLRYFSPRDALILLAALVQSNPDVRDDCDEDTLSIVMTYGVFQTLDVGCEQASSLALRVITENHPENAAKAANVKSRSTRSELTAKQR